MFATRWIIPPHFFLSMPPCNLAGESANICIYFMCTLSSEANDLLPLWFQASYSVWCVLTTWIRNAVRRNTRQALHVSAALSFAPGDHIPWTSGCNECVMFTFSNEANYIINDPDGFQPVAAHVVLLKRAVTKHAATQATHSVMPLHFLTHVTPQSYAWTGCYVLCLLWAAKLTIDDPDGS